MRFVAAVGGFRPSPLTFVAMAASVASAVVVLVGFSSPPRNGVVKVWIRFLCREPFQLKVNSFSGQSQTQLKAGRSSVSVKKAGDALNGIV
jgi:hypothetical protein